MKTYQFIVYLNVAFGCEATSNKDLEKRMKEIRKTLEEQFVDLSLQTEFLGWDMNSDFENDKEAKNFYLED